jgi:hypothetical protein
MMARVQQHVPERVSHFARGAKEPEMIAIGEHRTAPAPDPVHRAREPRADGLHAASERVAVARLHDEMSVVALERVVHQPELRAFATA